MIICWPLHLKRRLRPVPRAEANFKHLLSALAKGRLIWKPPCAANPGLFGLGDENREALISCVWWWVCVYAYWKTGSVIVTTLAMASYFVGLAGTKANKTQKKKKCKSFKENLQRNQTRRLLLGLRKYWQTTAGEGHRVGSRAPSRQTARNQRSLQALELSKEAKKKQQQLHLALVGDAGHGWQREPEPRLWNYHVAPLTLDPICSVLWAHFHQSGPKMHRPIESSWLNVHSKRGGGWGGGTLIDVTISRAKSPH